MSEEWWCGSHEDGCSWTGPFDTKAEAVEEILADLEAGEMGFVGRSGPLPFAPLICATTLIDRLIENVCEQLDTEHHEYEDWLGAVTSEQESELEVALNAELSAWMEKHGYALPTVIVNVEKIEREAPRAEIGGES